MCVQCDEFDFELHLFKNNGQKYFLNLLKSKKKYAKIKNIEIKKKISKIMPKTITFHV
jgi:hypothetical protein